MVVEDREALRRIYATILQRAGYQVITAANGQEALAVAAAAALAPALVVLDLSMPGLSGQETFARLRASMPAIKVVFMSGSEPGALEGPAGLKEQSDWLFLQKPFDAKRLLAAVGRLLGSAAAER